MDFPETSEDWKDLTEVVSEIPIGEQKQLITFHTKVMYMYNFLKKCYLTLRKLILQLRDTVSEMQKTSRFILTHSVVYTLKLRKSFFLNISHTYCLQFPAWAIYY